MGNKLKHWPPKKKGFRNNPATPNQKDFLRDLFRDAMNAGVITVGQFEAMVEVINTRMTFDQASEIIQALADMRRGKWRGEMPEGFLMILEEDESTSDEVKESKAKKTSSADPYYEVHLGDARNGLVSHGLTESDACDLAEKMQAGQFSDWTISVWRAAPDEEPRLAVIFRGPEEE